MTSSPSCARPSSAKSTLNSPLVSPARSCPGCNTISTIFAWDSLGTPLRSSSFFAPSQLTPLPAPSPASSSASKASIYASGTSEAGRSDLMRAPRSAFLGVGRPHGESLPSISSENRPLPVLPEGFASSSNSEDDCFARAGTSSSPKSDIGASQWQMHGVRW